MGVVEIRQAGGHEERVTNQMTAREPWSLHFFIFFPLPSFLYLLWSLRLGHPCQVCKLLEVTVARCAFILSHLVILPSLMHQIRRLADPHFPYKVRFQLKSQISTMHLAATAASDWQPFLLIPSLPENNQIFCELEMH